MPAPQWTREILGCKASGSSLQHVDCSLGQICAPKPAAPFDAKMCVLHDGDTAWKKGAT